MPTISGPTVADNRYIINIIDMDAIESLACETLRQRESSPAVTALLAKCLLSVRRDLRAVVQP